MSTTQTKGADTSTTTKSFGLKKPSAFDKKTSVSALQSANN